jgi:membrane fusion protein, multidrug efflux system
MGKMKFSRKFLGFGLAAFLVAASLSGCSRSESKAQPENSQNQPRVVPVSVVPVTPSPMKDILLLPGETEAWQDLVLGAETGGRVEWVGPKEGDFVKQGNLIARIDVAALKAGLDRAEAALRLAEELYERRVKLFERNIVHREELDKALAEQALARANVNQARVEYERGFIRAPINGVVNHLFVKEGEFVDRGKPFLEMVNVDRVIVNVNVPELDVRFLQKGQKTMVRVDAFHDRELAGTIDFVAFKADPATKTFLTKVMIENPGHEIRPGMIARVAFLRKLIPDALSAPLFALIDKGGERIVFVEKDGVALARTVSIGVIEGDRVQITSGLEPGDRLIVTGQRELEEGMKVQPR